MKFYNPLGTVHGGWISAILDSAMGCAVHSTLAAGQTYTTINMTVNFVRPVFETTGKVRCEGVAVHGGAVPGSRPRKHGFGMRPASCSPMARRRA